jgi:hypothetical protein
MSLYSPLSTEKARRSKKWPQSGGGRSKTSRNFWTRPKEAVSQTETRTEVDNEGLDLAARVSNVIKHLFLCVCH